MFIFILITEGIKKKKLINSSQSYTKKEIPTWGADGDVATLGEYLVL